MCRGTLSPNLPTSTPKPCIVHMHVKQVCVTWGRERQLASCTLDFNPQTLILNSKPCTKHQTLYTTRRCVSHGDGMGGSLLVPSTSTPKPLTPNPESCNPFQVCATWGRDERRCTFRTSVYRGTLNPKPQTPNFIPNTLNRRCVCKAGVRHMGAGRAAVRGSEFGACAGEP